MKSAKYLPRVMRAIAPTKILAWVKCWHRIRKKGRRREKKCDCSERMNEMNDIGKDKINAKLWMCLCWWDGRGWTTRDRSIQDTRHDSRNSILVRLFEDEIHVLRRSHICSIRITYYAVSNAHVPSPTPYTHNFRCHATPCITYEHIISEAFQDEIPSAHLSADCRVP